MVHWLPRVIQKLRRSKKIGVSCVLALVALSIFGNAVTFYVFDGPLKPDLTFADAVWYSIISMTTIGYGDFSATSPGARAGTVFFIVLMGLSAFSTMLGMLIDAMIHLNIRELHGMSNTYCKNHVLIAHFPDEGRVRKIIQELRDDPEYAEVDIVMVNDTIEANPFELENVFFVKGSPLQIETLERACLKDASLAIVLCTNQADSSSDGIVASVVTLIEHLRPEIKTVAECLNRRHAVLFRSSKCDSVVYTNQLIDNLLVQETQDPGVASLVSELTDNGQGFTLYSATVDCNFDTSYSEVAQKMASQAYNLISVERGAAQLIDYSKLKAQKGDRVVYVATRRHSWKELCSQNP